MINRSSELGLHESTDLTISHQSFLLQQLDKLDLWICQGSDIIDVGFDLLKQC